MRDNETIARLEAAGYQSLGIYVTGHGPNGLRSAFELTHDFVQVRCGGGVLIYIRLRDAR